MVRSEIALTNSVKHCSLVGFRYTPSR